VRATLGALEREEVRYWPMRSPVRCIAVSPRTPWPIFRAPLRFGRTRICRLAELAHCRFNRRLYTWSLGGVLAHSEPQAVTSMTLNRYLGLSGLTQYLTTIRDRSRGRGRRAFYSLIKRRVRLSTRIT
jgi:hypothetical protein